MPFFFLISIWIHLYYVVTTQSCEIGKSKKPTSHEAATRTINAKKNKKDKKREDNKHTKNKAKTKA